MMRRSIMITKVPKFVQALTSQCRLNALPQIPAATKHHTNPAPFYPTSNTDLQILKVQPQACCAEPPRPQMQKLYIGFKLYAISNVSVQAKRIF